ncbi:MAG: hypothetical protein U1E45_15565 [Geminicoccaceae bacterium]
MVRQSLAALVALTLLAGCSRATIVSGDEKHVTLAWQNGQSDMNKVTWQAKDFCDQFHAEAFFVSDDIDGPNHTTTFRCGYLPGLDANVLINNTVGRAERAVMGTGQGQ